MKNEVVFIKGRDLDDNWCSDYTTPEDVAGRKIGQETWYEVSWPDHVSNPRFNGDCCIQEADLDRVIRLGDGALICEECLSKHCPDTPVPEVGWQVGVCHYHRQVYGDTHYSAKNG